MVVKKPLKLISVWARRKFSESRFTKHFCTWKS